MSGKRAVTALRAKEAFRTSQEVGAESREAKAFGREPALERTAFLQRVGARRGR
jgi:hypothetical protein